jgi:hypothetical protein
VSPRRSFRAFAIVCLAVLVAAGCGGGGDDDDTEPTTTSSTSSTTSTTTTTPPVAPKAALTGLPVDDPAVLSRPAIAVKINNADGDKCDFKARPQSGLDQADIVFEEVVEGGITRFFAVFQSTVPETVGPVRSARSSDVDLIEALNVPLFAWSGNNPGVGGELGAIKDRFVNVGHSSSAGSKFYRENSFGRCAPSNLFVHPADLYEFASGQGAVPAPVFTYREEGATAPASAVPVAGVRLNTALDTVFVWNPGTKSWDRSQRRTPHVTDKDVRISPANVVILDVPYRTSAADPRSPQAVSVGSGPAHVYLDGVVVEGTWTRDTPQSAWVLKDAAGAPIPLVPGRTWVQLARDSDGLPENLDLLGVGPYTAA